VDRTLGQWYDRDAAGRTLLCRLPEWGFVPCTSGTMHEKIAFVCAMGEFGMAYRPNVAVLHHEDVAPGRQFTLFMYHGGLGPVLVLHNGFIVGPSLTGVTYPSTVLDNTPFQLQCIIALCLAVNGAQASGDPMVRLTAIHGADAAFRERKVAAIHLLFPVNGFARPRVTVNDFCSTGTVGVATGEPSERLRTKEASSPGCPTAASNVSHVLAAGVVPCDSQCTTVPLDAEVARPDPSDTCGDSAAPALPQLGPTPMPCELDLDEDEVRDFFMHMYRALQAWILARGTSRRH